MTLSRLRARGRRGGEVEHFAKIPESVMKSEAVKTLNHAHFRVLAIIALQYSGYNNGTMAATPLYVEQFGLRGRDTVYRALRELTARGLLVQTRQGIKQRDVFSLYALGWVDIDYRDGKKLERSEPRNNRRWLDWRPTASQTRTGPCAPSNSSCTEKISDRRPVREDTERRE